MDYNFNPNVLYYIKCRDHLHEQCVRIFNECRRLFGNEAPKTSRSITKLIEMRQFSKRTTPQDCLSIVKVDLFDYDLDDKHQIKSLKFNLNHLSDLTGFAPEKILFYICCRFQLDVEIKTILYELTLLYPDHVMTQPVVEEVLSDCFGVDLKTRNDTNNKSINCVQVKMELIEQNDSYSASLNNMIEFKTNQSSTAYSFQEQIEQVDLECAKLRTANKVLSDEKQNLEVELDKLTVEFEVFKTESHRELNRLNHQIKFLQDTNKIEAEKNFELNSKLSGFKFDINDLISENSKLHDDREELREKQKLFEEERNKLIRDNIAFNKSQKQLVELDKMRNEMINQASATIKHLKKQNDDLKKEIQELKTTSARVEYLKHLHEISSSAKNLQEKTEQIERLNSQITLLKQELDASKNQIKQNESDLISKTNASLDQANLIKQMEVQILNLKAVNIDLETRFKTNYYNMYAPSSSNHYQSSSYNPQTNYKKNHRFRSNRNSFSSSNDQVIITF